MTELHSNDAGYTHSTSGLSRSLKKLVGGLFQLNRVQYLSKKLNLLIILKNIHKDYNQQNATHPCAYGVAVRGFEDKNKTCTVISKFSYRMKSDDIMQITEELYP